MTMPKAFAGTALILAVAILSPAAALATKGGTDRPTDGRGSGTITVDTSTGAFTGKVTGNVNHLGRVTVQLEGTGMPTDDGRFVGTGTATIIAANGDELTGSFTLSTTQLLPTGHITTVEITITGGTGRFADATGTLTVVCDVGPPTVMGTTVLTSLECTVAGRISY